MLSSPKDLKIVFFGNALIGKSSFVWRFADGEFPSQTLPTVATNFRMKKVIIDDLELRLQLLDTAGGERNEAIAKTYYKDANGVVIMFDLTDQCSFNEVKVWLEYIESQSDQKVCKIILGNKCDLQEKRVVDKQAIRELVKEAEAPYFEVSAKTGENVEVSILHLAKALKRILIPSKIVIIGTGPVGKTCLTHALADGKFPLQTLPTIGVDFKDKIIMIENSQLKLRLWDTPGHPRFHDITKSYFRSADAVLVIFDLTDQNSFDEVKVWIEHLKKNNYNKICKMILGNKCDLEEKRVIDKQTIRDLVKEVRIPYFEVSAKTGENIEDALLNFARDIKKTFMNDKKAIEAKKHKSDENNSKLDLDNLNGVHVSECNIF